MQRASHHAKHDGLPVIRSFEPGEDWFWDYATDEFLDGPTLVTPEHHPLDQPIPGPSGRVPADWQRHLH
jgi:hypothetical protein